MDFLKKNYEKILLGVVLAGLVGVVVFLFIWVSSEKQKLSERTQNVIQRKAKPIPALNMEYYDTLLQASSSPEALDLSMTNRLFNPVKWQKSPDGKLIKIVRGDEVGPRALVVTNITPLYMAITLDSVTTNESSVRYKITVEREAAPTPSLRKKSYYISYPFIANNNKNDAFVITDVKGLPEDPELDLTLTDSGTEAVISKTKSYRQPEAYMADVRYPPENRTFKNCRVGSALVFGGEEYNVVAISDKEVVVSAKSNNKKTTITYAGAP